MFRIHSNYQEMQADQCLPNQHNSLQSEIMQHYSDIRSLQQVYQNSHSNNQSQNYTINCQPNNNFAMPNNQMIQHIVHNNVDNNGQKWHSLINHSQLQQPVFNNFNQSPYQHSQTYINQRPPNTLQSSNVYPPSDNYLPHDQIMQPNKETISEQFFLHNIQPQKYRKSWDLAPTSQTHSFAQESQNIWNGR